MDSPCFVISSSNSLVHDGVLPYNGSNDWNSVQSTLDHWINFNNTTTNPTSVMIVSVLLERMEQENLPF